MTSTPVQPPVRAQAPAPARMPAPAAAPVAAPAPRRVFSAFQASGRLTLGNYLGAILPAVRLQDEAACVYAVADLHALTVRHDPAHLRARTREVATLLLASGLDRSPLYLQSRVPAHTELSYLMESTAHDGEMRRMIQFKEKSAAQEEVRLSLLTYPALMAADILLHRADLVPVGEDQRQHLELTRDLALRFNRRYGETFVVPEAVHPETAARVMDLAVPTAKMSKSAVSEAGTVYLLDPPADIRRKIMRAVTDSGSGVRHDPAAKPGVSNLLVILAACSGRPVASLSYGSYGALKKDTAEAVIEALTPVRERFAVLSADPAELDRLLAAAAARVIEETSGLMAAARRAIGLG
ncbi:tryptophan--tRNA ligase [Planomonospora venezuelensis]|uniref:Tryptophan--tRNA ligase n=1 Tax=Planomonospora venezuelensis TaxID=1999 RepID=A0A841CXY0_PLAVE|nr:tryptophan--tRNA ligase [Planomonospora venezuelensis]MBB5961663.1 tryptophanyl-tRNA synthetase [Planomonospora venezuelensis]GIM98809.1 tryptophan--tRNA ligase 1 [Planomonospora venezuelensis]